MYANIDLTYLECVTPLEYELICNTVESSREAEKAAADKSKPPMMMKKRSKRRSEPDA